MYSLDLDKKLEDIEKNVRVMRNDPSLCRRARRILRIKIYFLFHGRDNIMEWANPLPPVNDSSGWLLPIAVTASFIAIGLVFIHV
jgi:hypothetical protein